MPHAVVIGAGPNGLVGANLLADEGWDVAVFEAQEEPGGAVRSGEITRPGFVHDLFSAFYPLAAASPVIRDLDLGSYGLVWDRAPLALANPTASGLCPVLSTDPEVTARDLDTASPGDGERWLELHQLWARVGDDLVRALFAPFPPAARAAVIAARLGPRGLARFARFASLPVRTLAEERFTGIGPGLLLGGNALHSDLSPGSALSGFYGWLLASLAHDVGWPVPRGGAGRFSDALVARLRAKGGTVACGAEVTRVVIRGGRAVGVRLADGGSVSAERAVLADCGAPSLFLELVGAEHLPSSFLDDLERFRYDHGTVKVDWALSGPVPWNAPAARRAGTVHLADDMDEMTEFSALLEMGIVAARPFMLVGQMTTTDPTRSPPGTETAWAYAHVPQNVRGDAGGDITGTWDEREVGSFVARMEARIERLAPGFSARILDRHVMGPREMQARDANLVGGAINGGTAHLHQQLIFRPVAGTGRPTTPIESLYLASASAHPGGGVHGAPGANAARAALAARRRKNAIIPLAAAATAGMIGSRRRH